MGVEFKKNFDLSAMAKKWSEQSFRMLGREGELCLKDIRAAAQIGEDVEGNRFAPYSKDYKAWKQGDVNQASTRWVRRMQELGNINATYRGVTKRGKITGRYKGVANIVNLVLTGAMLRGMRSTVYRMSTGILVLRLFFLPSERAKAKANVERPKNDPRQFFKFSEKRLEIIRRQIGKIIK